MCDFFIWDGCAIAVDAAHEIPDHILGLGFFGWASLASLADDAEVDLAHTGMSEISLAVVRQRCPGEHEVYRRETEVKVVVEVGEFGGQLCSDFVSLESATGCEDGNFCHDGAEVDGAGLTFEVAGCFDVLVDFFFDEWDVGF
jgi:hypothetical protein